MRQDNHLRSARSSTSAMRGVVVARYVDTAYWQNESPLSPRGGPDLCRLSYRPLTTPTTLGKALCMTVKSCVTRVSRSWNLVVGKF